MAFIREYKKEISWIVIILCVMGVISFLVYEPMMSFFQNSEVMKEKLCSYGILGQAILMLIMAMQVIFVFLPGEIIEVSAGLLYGSWVGMLICLLGAALGTTIIYLIVKKFGMRFVNMVYSNEKCQKMKFLQDSKKLSMIVFFIFLIPGTPKDMITYLTPLTDMKLPQLLLITTIARIPSVLTSTVAGNALGLENYMYSISIFVVTGLLSIAGMFFYKNKIIKGK